MQQGGVFLLGGRNLTRSNFDHSENCYLVGENETLVVVGLRGGQKFGEGGLLGGIFPDGRGMSKFSELTCNLLLCTSLLIPNFYVIDIEFNIPIF